MHLCPTLIAFYFNHLFTYLKNSVFLCLLLPFPPGVLCSVISISLCLLFFSCNQTHRFISVALRHHLNQFPSTLPSWRVAVRVGTLQLGTHLYAYTHTFSFIHPRSHWSTQTGTYKTHTGLLTHTHTYSYRWFTTSLFSNVLLASSLQHPFVTVDRSWQQHLSILPLSSLRQPTLCFSQPWPSPQLGFFLNFGRRTEDGTQMVAILMQGHVFRWRSALIPASVFNPSMGLWVEELANQLFSVVSRRVCDALARRT